MYLLGLSGPPHCGKDTIGAALADLFGERLGLDGKVQLIALSQPMRHAVYAMAGMTYDSQHYEEFKDQPLALFNGKTIRHEMIELSERHVKPRLGQGFWGVAGMNRILIGTKVVIVTDMGFDAERKVFEENFGVENCVWCQIERPGTDWSKDSRGYVGDPSVSHVTQLHNGATIEEAATRLYSRLLNNFGWKLDCGA